MKKSEIWPLFWFQPHFSLSSFETEQHIYMYVQGHITPKLIRVKGFSEKVNQEKHVESSLIQSCTAQFCWNLESVALWISWLKTSKIGDILGLAHCFSLITLPRAPEICTVSTIRNKMSLLLHNTNLDFFLILRLCKTQWHSLPRYVDMRYAIRTFWNGVGHTKDGQRNGQ